MYIYRTWQKLAIYQTIKDTLHTCNYLNMYPVCDGSLIRRWKHHEVSEFPSPACKLIFCRSINLLR